jgi:SPP1 family predicted phage head-tail adaptor
MQSGDLKHRITLQYPTVAKDATGAPVTTWNDAATVWAAIWPISANETVQANATTMVISHRIRIRCRSVVRGSWRVKYGVRYFAIASIINPNMANEWLDLMCKEAAA